MTNHTSPDTIVLIHGLWVTPRSWEHWIERYTSRGDTVIAPAYPGLEVEVEALNADLSPIEALTVPAVIESYERVISELDKPPIIIGHSFGGLIVQILLDHLHPRSGRLGRSRRLRPRLGKRARARNRTRLAPPPTATQLQRPTPGRLRAPRRSTTSAARPPHRKEKTHARHHPAPRSQQALRHDRGL